MNKFAIAFAAAGIFTFSTLASSNTIVSDTFESGDMSATTAYGFGWSKGKINPVVTVAPEASQWEAKSGDHALMMRYRAGKNWAEKRFHWSEPQPEIWMSYWLRVPTNYAHPEVDGASDNQKLFYLWMDAYSTKGEGSSVGMEFRGNGRGGSYFYGKISPGGYKGSGGDTGRTSFIEIPRDRGRWMHLVVHAASESSAGANDGLMEVWRKWESESEYTKTHELKNQKIRLSSSVKGFSQGYLMGWANAAYPVDTEFLLDDFELSTTPLFLNSNSPNAPTELVIK